MNNNQACPIPECAKPWSEDFLLENLPKTWMYGEFRKHREKHCLDLERARLPETQEDARRYQEAKKFIAAVDVNKAAVQARIDALPQTVARKAADAILTAMSNDIKKFCKKHKLNYWYDTTGNPELRKMNGALAAKKTELNIYAIRRAHNKLIANLKDEKKAYGTPEYIRAESHVYHFGRVRHYTLGDAEEPAKKNWSFTMKCPMEACEGFVGLDWNCGLCSTAICKDCREEKIRGHECDPEKRESIRALAKEAKPCPKCAAQISKIDGCDQMWCTQCQTAFSWKTGTIEHRIHNPHYYEWMRRNGKQIPVAGAPALNDCMTPDDIIRNARTYLLGKPAMYSWIQPIAHIQLDAIYHVRARTDASIEESKRVLRVKRLTGSIDDKVWGQHLELLNIQQRRDTDGHDILQMFINASTDLLREAM